MLFTTVKNILQFILEEKIPYWFAIILSKHEVSITLENTR